MIPTHATAVALRDRIRATLAADGAPTAVVTTDVTEASAAVTTGTCAIVIPPPRVTNQGPVTSLEYEVPIIGAPTGDQNTAWQALDTLIGHLDAAGALDPWDDLTPITWGGSQTAQAPAYLATITLSVSK